MRLINLQIENFGTLSHYQYEFENGLNVIKAENGFGKTTLGAFIKVMFYGFENEGKLRAKRERLKYMPWQGGTYGGSIRFEHGGKEYKMTRSFGEDKKKDSFELVDALTKLESKDFESESIGETIFGINGESFARTLFISQNEYSHSSFTDIDAKIGNLVEAADDLNDHDQAIKLLEKQKDEIGTYRRGVLKELKTELDDLKSKVLGKQGIERSMKDTESEITACNQEILELKKEEGLIQEQMEQVAKRQDRQRHKKVYETLLASYEDSKEKYLQEKNYFPGEIPSPGDLNAIMEEARRLKSLNTKMEDYSLGEDASKALGQLEDQYAGMDLGVEDEQHIQGLVNFWCKEREEIKNRIQQRSLSKTELEQLQEEERRFKDHPVNAEENKDLVSLWREHEAIKSKLEAGKNESSKTENTKGNKNILLLGIIAATVGISWFIALPHVKILGVFLFVLGIAMAFRGVLKGNPKEDPASAYDPNCRLGEIEKKIQDYFLTYQMNYDPDTVEYNLRSILSQYESYRSLSARRDQTVSANMTDGRRISYMEDQVKTLLEKYHFEYKEANVLLDLNQITQDFKTLESYRNTRNQYKQAKKEYEESMKKITSFLKAYEFPFFANFEQSLDEIKEHMSLYQVRRDSYIESKDKKEDFERQHEDYKQLLVATEEIEEDSLTKLAGEHKKINEEIAVLTKQKMTADKRLNDLNDSYNEICECEERILVLKEEKETCLEKKKILEKAMDHLEAAKNQLNARYAAPIENALKEYFKQLAKDSDITIDIDAKRQVLIKEKGASRSEESMSLGYKDLIELCYRLALAKAMYPEESSLLILDDPFSNLDEEKLEKGMELIKKISEDNQVLYFTCHSSRALVF